MKWLWNWTMLNLCGIVVAILKMATGRNFSMSGHHHCRQRAPIENVWSTSGIF
jgi:hypothetical protein